MSKGLGIVFILVFLFSTLVFTQDNQVNEDRLLREEILAAYKSGGEQELRHFVKKKKDKISNTFIVDFAKAGKNKRKEEWLRISKIIAKEKKDEKTLADVLYQTGEYYRFILDKKKAADYFDKALPIYIRSKDPVGQGNVYWNKGSIYFNTGDNTRALKMFDKALPFFERAGFPIGQGKVYVSKGSVYSRIGDNSKALEMYDKALYFFEKAGAPLGQGNVYKNKGNTYFILGENSKALEMYDKALYFHEKGGNPLGQGAVYMGKGHIYFYIRNNSRALEMYDKALHILGKVGSIVGQGNAYMGKGHIYSKNGDKPGALEMYDKALTFYEKAGVPIGRGNVYGSKGTIYRNIGDNSRALEMYDKALPFFEKAGQHIGQGNVYLGKGHIYEEIGDNSKALEMFDRSLPFFEKAGFSIGQGNVYMGKGRIYGEIGDNSRASEMYDKAMLYFEKAGHLEDLGAVYLNKGVIYSSIGENSRALEMYDKALLFFKKGGHLKWESSALHGKAKVLVKLGKKDEALSLFEKSIANLEKVRMQTAISEMKRTFMENVYEDYHGTVLFMLENKYHDKGFKYAESMRARVFLDQMAEGLVRLDKGLTPDMKEKRDNLATKLSLLSKKMHKTAGKKEKKKLQELKEQYRKTEREFEDLLVKIRLNNPLYSSVRYPQPVSIRTLQKEILKKGELLLRYFIAPDKLYVFLVAKDDFKVVPLNVKEKEIKRIVERYLQALGENNGRDMKKYGKTLYKKLFKPLETFIKESGDIFIIPDGELAKIPFESLILDDTAYLMEKLRVKYIQSASLLTVLRKHYRRDRETKNFIGFGDPVYDYENFKQGKPELGTITRSPGKGDELRGIHRSRYARAGGIMNRLPRSGEEVNSIAQLFERKSHKILVHLREQAKEGNAKTARMKDFDYIHFACHGLLNDDFQSLVLSQLPSEKSPEDGYFTLNEIMNCDYNAKLVVLSACRTGSGKLERAEGVTGLTRAVMYAGTPAVVAGLWDVDDTATKELMVRFYRNMLERNMDKVEALRQAKLELLKTKDYTSPLFWSAFIMYGE